MLMDSCFLLLWCVFLIHIIQSLHCFSLEYNTFSCINLEFEIKNVIVIVIVIFHRHFQVSAKEDRGILHIFEKLLEQANIPHIRKLEPVLKRRLSANASNVNRHRDRLREQEESKLSRSRSLIRRASKPKVKHTGDMGRNDCCIS